jgi:hypothetical protein
MPIHIRKQFEGVYTSKTNLDQDIGFNGYYFSKEITIHKVYQFKKEPELIQDTAYSYLIFFDDGVFVSGFYDLNRKKRIMNEDNIPLFLVEIANNNDMNTNNLFYSKFNWGVYTMNRDTIFAKWVYHIDGSAYWYSAKDIYTIIDKDSIIKIQTNTLYGTGKYAPHNITSKRHLYTFRVCEKNTWLKNNEWFWHDKEQFERWKIHHK